MNILYCFLILLLILFLIMYCYLIQIHLIYLQFPLYNQYEVIDSLLTNEEADFILKESLNYAYKNGWTLNRHDDYPTTDNEIASFWKSYNILYDKCNKIIYKKLEDLFFLIHDKLTISEFFVCKYNGNDSKKQSNLEFHVDQYEFSFVIALNDNFEGGGTLFEKSNELVKLKKGDCLIFCGQTRHGGNKVIKGLRFIVSGFLKYGDLFYDDIYDSDD